MDGDLRIELPALFDTADEIEAFVQYCSRTTWSRIVLCASNQGISNINQVACGQLGYQGMASKISNMKIFKYINHNAGVFSKRADSSVSTSTPPLNFISLNCSSGVTNVQECEVMVVDECPGTLTAHANINCDKGTYTKPLIFLFYVLLGLEGCTDGRIRLVSRSTNTNSEGRVEVCLDGRWGTVQTNQAREVAGSVCSRNSLTVESFTTCLGQKKYKL